jgi:predicted lactoylglutathione lyase
MAAFTAPSRDAVDAAYAAAMTAGAYDEGPPGLRPHFAPNYYGAYVRDPDGNKLHFICRGGN